MKYEYLKLFRPSVGEMNIIGEEGWELVGITGWHDKDFYFKRPLLDEN